MEDRKIMYKGKLLADCTRVELEDAVKAAFIMQQDAMDTLHKRTEFLMDTIKKH